MRLYSPKVGDRRGRNWAPMQGRIHVNHGRSTCLADRGSDLFAVVVIWSAGWSAHKAGRIMRPVVASS